MCRLLGYIGPRVELAGLVYGPPNSLEHQSWAPTDQQHGTINADGWGIGWYDRSLRPEPARYRTSTPMWADRNFADMAPLLSSEVVLAAVRDATPGMAVVDTGAPPFTDGPWLFAHNGVIPAFRDGVGTRLRRSLSERREAGLLGTCDSEVAFALVLDRLDDGYEPIDAVRESVRVIRRTVERTQGVGVPRLNFLLTDGVTLLGTSAGDTLVLSTTPTPSGPATLIASEALDDDPTWVSVADNTVVIADRDGAALEPLLS